MGLLPGVFEVFHRAICGPTISSSLALQLQMRKTQAETSVIAGTILDFGLSTSLNAKC
jgi:hypothetical protein